MVRDALRGYLNLASGLTDVTLARATTAARAMVAQGEATAEQVTSIADDLMASSRRNREAIVTLVRYEVDQALRRIGLAPAEEVATLTDRVRRLEAAVREANSAPSAATASSSTARSGGGKTTAKRTASKKTASKRTAAKRSAGTSTTRASSAARKTAAKKTTTTNRAASTSSAGRATARKTTAKRTTAKRTGTKTTARKRA